MTGVLNRYPHPLIDTLLERMHFSNDTELADRLRISPSAISKIRRGHNLVTATIILKVYDMTGWPIEDIRKLINNYRGY